LKGYGLGERAEGTNTTHQKKQMSDKERMEIAQRLDIPLSEKAIKEAQFFVPDQDSEEMQYLHEKRKNLGGYQPIRFSECKSIKTPSIEIFQDFLDGIDRSISTTLSLVRMISKLLRDKELGKYLVPNVLASSGTIGTRYFPNSLSLRSFEIILTKDSVVAIERSIPSKKS
jgi:pyruvate dehydrogenase E1 component